jgi:hypothetical protein
VSFRPERTRVSETTQWRNLLLPLLLRLLLISFLFCGVISTRVDSRSEAAQWRNLRLLLTFPEYTAPRKRARAT